MHHPSLRAWLIIGLLGIAATQPFQERQNTRAPQKHQEVEKQAPPPAIMPPSSGVPEASSNQPAATKKASYWQDAIAPSTLSNWVLAVAAIGAIFVGVWTLLAIRDQGKVLINSERAWVLVEIGQIPAFEPDPNGLQILWIRPTITNHGKTPARIKHIVARTELVPDGQRLPVKPEYPIGQGADLRVDVMLPPGVPIQPIKLGVNGQEFIQIRNGEKFLYLHGFIDYLDLGSIKRHSGFCFFYAVQSGYSPDPTGFYFELTAPPAYTECT